jgi:ribosomal protein L11 methyltransferase
VEEQVEVRCGSIESVLDGEEFDFVVANINRNILVAMMPRFGELTRVGGELLCSGFLREDVPHIEASVRECGFVVEGDVERDGWVVVKCKRV